MILSLRRHDIAHIASSVYLASSGAGFLPFSTASAFNKSVTHLPLHSIEIFEQRHEFLRFLILPAGLDCKNIEES